MAFFCRTPRVTFLDALLSPTNSSHASRLGVGAKRQFYTVGGRKSVSWGSTGSHSA